MSTPYIPTPLSTPIINPAVGSTGAPPIPYISNAEYIFAPTAMSTKDLNPGGFPQAQTTSLADVIRRASSWCDAICFGSDAATKGASLAASLTVDSATIRIKNGELRLLCDYRPLVQLVGLATGSGIGAMSSIDPSTASLIRVGRRTFSVPIGGPIIVNRTGDQPAVLPDGIGSSSLYAIWSYVNGYPHTSLAASVSQGATTCVVNSTDGNGGLWGVFPASSPFPGTGLRIVDGSSTEIVFVQSIATGTPSANQTTLTTSAFTYAHTVPAAPDFIPVSSLPDNVHQAVISLTTMLIKTRGVRGLNMPTVPGGRVTQVQRDKLGQAGATEDWEVARKLLEEGGYVVHVKHPGSY